MCVSCIKLEQDDIKNFQVDKTKLPRNGATIRLPPPLLVIRIRSPILLTSYGCTKVRAIGIIEWIRLVINPFTRRKITFPLWVFPSLNHKNSIFLIEPRPISNLKLRGQPIKEAEEKVQEKDVEAKLKLQSSHGSSLWSEKGPNEEETFY